MAKKKKGDNQVRFWKGKLPTVVWDAKNDRELCNFAEGHYTTSDPRVIETLKGIGYIEIPLDATQPPEIIEPIQPDGMADVKPLPASITEKGAAKLQKSSTSKPKRTVVKTQEDEHGPEVPAPSLNKAIVDADTESVPDSGKKKKKSTTRKIKRRK